VELTLRYTTPDIHCRHRRHECDGGINLRRLELRHLQVDLVWCNKILFGIVDTPTEDFFIPSTYAPTGGYQYKLFKKPHVSNTMANVFSERVVNSWNSLPDGVDFSSLPRFKRCINKVDFFPISRVFLKYRYFHGVCFVFCISYFACILCSKATIRAHLSLVCLVQLRGLLCYHTTVLLLVKEINDDDDDDDEFRRDLWRQQTRVPGLLCDPMFSCFDTIPDCYRHTDRETDRHTTTAYTALA